MASGFDPYYKWLGIPPEEQPPNHYRLLGLRLFERDPEVIESASDQRMAHLRTYQTGRNSALSQKLLNEVAGAKICLLSPEKHSRYDETLRGAESGEQEAENKPSHRLLIVVLATCTVLLGLVTAVVYFTKGKRTKEAVASEGILASADPVAEDLLALQKHARELSIVGPLGSLHGTRLGQSLWLHMNFQRNTIVEYDKMLFVKDLSGLNHHGICRQGHLVPGRAGDVLQCETPLRLLSAAVNRVPQFTLLAWVRCPRSATTAWWFDENLVNKSLFAVGCGNDLQLRAFSKSKQKTTDPIHLTKLVTPPDQWNFIALRSELREGDTYLTIQVNDQKLTINNPDLFPIQAADIRSRAFFANTPKTQLAELMIFRAALSDANIQALRTKATNLLLQDSTQLF